MCCIAVATVHVLYTVPVLILPLLHRYVEVCQPNLAFNAPHEDSEFKRERAMENVADYISPEAGMPLNKIAQLSTKRMSMSCNC